jgi:hypothetical protein
LLLRHKKYIHSRKSVRFQTEHLGSKTDLRRVIDLSNLEGVSKSTIMGSQEFVVHVKGQYDYRYKSTRRDEIIFTLKLAFISKVKSDLPCYGISSKDLREITTTEKDSEKGNFKIPGK